MNGIIKACFLTYLAFFDGASAARKSDDVECRNKVADFIGAKEVSPGIVSRLSPCISGVNDPVSGRKTTLLHLASEKGNLKVMDLLLEEGAEIDPTDDDGLTPLLRSATRGKSVAADLLVERGADVSRQSKFGGDYIDYLRMTTPVRNQKVPNDSSYLVSIPDSLNIEPQCLPKGVLATHENVIQPKALDGLIRGKSAASKQMVEIAKAIVPRRLQGRFLESYAEYKQSPRALSVSVVKATDKGEPIRFKMCGLTAQESIPKGTVIAEYTGEVEPSNSFDPTYRVDDYPVVDSMKYRSAASMSNHGFPNAQLVHLAGGDFDKGLDGLPFRKVLVSIQDIAEGEEIVWNYGPNYDVSNQIEIRPVALNEFIRTTSWKDIIEGFKIHDSTEISEEKALEVFEKFTKFACFVESPSIVRFAVKNKYITKADLNLFKRAMKNPSLGPLALGLSKAFVKAVEPYFKSKSEL